MWNRSICDPNIMDSYSETELYGIDSLKLAYS